MQDKDQSSAEHTLAQDSEFSLEQFSPIQQVIDQTISQDDITSKPETKRIYSKTKIPIKSKQGSKQQILSQQQSQKIEKEIDNLVLSQLKFIDVYFNTSTQKSMLIKRSNLKQLEKYNKNEIVTQRNSAKLPEINTRNQGEDKVYETFQQNIISEFENTPKQILSKKGQEFSDYVENITNRKKKVSEMETLRNEVETEVRLKFEDRQRQVLKKYVKDTKSKIKIGDLEMDVGSSSQTKTSRTPSELKLFKNSDRQQTKSVVKNAYGLPQIETDKKYLKKKRNSSGLKKKKTSKLQIKVVDMNTCRNPIEMSQPYLIPNAGVKKVQKKRSISVQQTAYISSGHQELAIDDTQSVESIVKTQPIVSILKKNATTPAPKSPTNFAPKYSGKPLNEELTKDLAPKQKKYEPLLDKSQSADLIQIKKEQARLQRMQARNKVQEIPLDYRDTEILSSKKKSQVSNNKEKFENLIKFNFDSSFKSVEHDMRSLDMIMRKKNQLDQRNKVLYGGKNIFPSIDKLEKLGNTGKLTGKKGVSFKE